MTATATMTFVSGGQHNRIVWYKNVGTNSVRQFEYMGNIRNSTGQVLALPTTPNPELPSNHCGLLPGD